jgi:hypothetical protein
MQNHNETDHAVNLQALRAASRFLCRTARRRKICAIRTSSKLGTGRVQARHRLEQEKPPARRRENLIHGLMATGYTGRQVTPSVTHQLFGATLRRKAMFGLTHERALLQRFRLSCLLELMRDAQTVSPVSPHKDS